MGKFVSFLLIGVILAILGITKVAEIDIPKYGRCIGVGTLIMGLSLIFSAVLEVIFKTAIFDYIVFAGCVIGLAIMLYGQFKYNKGIF